MDDCSSAVSFLKRAFLRVEAAECADPCLLSGCVLKAHSTIENRVVLCRRHSNINILDINVRMKIDVNSANQRVLFRDQDITGVAVCRVQIVLRSGWGMPLHKKPRRMR